MSTYDKDGECQSATELIADRIQLGAKSRVAHTDNTFAGHEICGNSGEWINGYASMTDQCMKHCSNSDYP